MKGRSWGIVGLTLLMVVGAAAAHAQTDPLPSWQGGRWR